MDTATIDNDILAELQEVMGDDLQVLLEAFIESAQQQFAELQTALDQGDGESLRKGAHTMKGAAVSVGGAALSTCFQVVEGCAQAGQFDQARLALSRAREVFVQFERDLGRWRDQVSAI